MNKGNCLNDTFKAIGSILVVVLPVLQFGFTWLPENISSLYVNKESFFFTSLITLLLSIFIVFAYRSNPYFKFVPNKTQQKKYFEYLNSLKQTSNITQQPESSDDPELPPFEITASKVALFSMIIFLLTALGFIWIGLTYNTATITTGYSFLQSLLYIVTFCLAIYILIHFSYQEYQRKQWKRNREERIQRAINLAIENKAFEKFPQINFVLLAEQNIAFRPQLIVQVKIDDQKYNILTNLNADELFEVSKVIENHAS